MATNRIVALAKAAASRSTERWKVGAVVYRGSRILGTGTNDLIKTAPQSFHAYKTRHAEFNALVKIPYSLRKGANIYVHRIGRDGLTHMAKPCPACEKMLEWAEIRHVEWSEDPS